jgi:hypothetical protein
MQPSGTRSVSRASTRLQASLGKIDTIVIIDTHFKIIKRRLDKSTPAPILAGNHSVAGRKM